ncbi:MAG: hypothetical protein V1726_04890 [Methanobacteriota archaeon]
MGLKITPVVFVICCVLFGLTLSGLIQNSIAQNERENVSIVDCSYNLTRRETRGRVMESWYNISVTFQNTGNKTSELTRIDLYEEVSPIPLKKFIQIGENETLTIIYEWPTALFRNQNMTISFYPNSSAIQPNQYNSGEYEFLLQVVDETTSSSTPGFTFLFLPIALVVLLFLRRYRR